MLVRLFSNRLGSLPIIPIAPLREQLELRRCGEGSPVTERIWIAIAMVWGVNKRPLKDNMFGALFWSGAECAAEMMGTLARLR